MRKHIVYQTYADDVVVSKNQNYHLPGNYQWVKNRWWERLLSKLSYGAGSVFAKWYCRCVLHIHVIDNSKGQPMTKQGFFVYGNHTQPVGDAFIPIYVLSGKRMRAIVSPANLGIPVLGKILPYLGAIPIPEFHKMKDFLIAVNHYTRKKNGIMIYPEAHVWPYYTQIRPFESAAFTYPVKLKLPVYCMTTTYQKRKTGDFPQITVYLDGPFEADSKTELQEQIMACMKERSKNSTYKYWTYEEEK